MDDHIPDSLNDTAESSEEPLGDAALDALVDEEIVLEEEEEAEQPARGRAWLIVLGIVGVIAALLATWYFLRPQSPAVIVVNGEKVSSAEFQELVKFEYYIQTGGAPIEQYGITPVEFAEYAQDTIINGIIIRQQAEQRGVAVSDAEIEAEVLLTFGGEGATSEEAQAGRDDFILPASETTGLSVEKLQALLHDRIGTGMLAERLIEELDFPVDQTQESVHAAHIMVETEEEAQAVIERLNAGEDFAAIAAELSLDTVSGANGGDLDWFARGMMIAPFEEAAFALEAGQISAPVQTQFGWHVIKVLERGDVPTTEAEQQAQRQQLFSEELEKWRSEAEIVVKEDWATYVPATLP
jgi:foldase protein PrsA